MWKSRRWPHEEQIYPVRALMLWGGGVWEWTQDEKITGIRNLAMMRAADQVPPIVLCVSCTWEAKPLVITIGGREVLVVTDPNCPPWPHDFWLFSGIKPKEG